MTHQLELNSSFSTLSIHADDVLALTSDIAPPINVSTTFRHKDASKRNPGGSENEPYVYSRVSSNARDRAETVLGTLCEGFAVTYSSGLAAGFAALIHYKPNRVAIRRGYHGTHGFLAVYKRHRDIDIIDIDDEFKAGDLVWIESPQNPSGEIFNIKKYTARAHSAGAKILVDATFAPPPLQHPSRLGVDMIMHSTSKYFAGHSDVLGGLLVVKDEEESNKLLNDRTYLGSIPGSLEAWLILRSLRTLKVRVQAQSATATTLAQWLNLASGGREHDGIPAGTLHSVLHSSVQVVRDKWSEEDILAHVPGGHGATFSVLLQTKQQAQQLPFALKLIQPATSLGGIDSLAEWRHEVDPKVDPRLIRISIGLEEIEDLKEDWRQGLKAVLAKCGTEGDAKGDPVGDKGNRV